MSKVARLFEIGDVSESRDKFDFKEEFNGMPTSVMTFNKSPELMSYLQEGDDTTGQVGHQSKAKLSGQALRYSVYIPDQAEFILKYYTNEGDLILDPFSGRGTRSQMTLKNKRRYVGYDTDPETVLLNNHLCQRNRFKEEDYNIICGDGTALEEYKHKHDIFDAVFTCPPYYNAEKYSNQPGDLSYLKDKEFDEKIYDMFGHLVRLIKPSTYDVLIEKEEDNFKRAEIYPIIITVGSKRDGSNGVIDMDYNFQSLARQHNLVLWDKLISINKSPFVAFTFRRNYKKRFLNKVHETTLVFAKFK